MSRLRVQQVDIPVSGFRERKFFGTFNHTNVAAGLIRTRHECTDDLGRSSDHALSINHTDLSSFDLLNGWQAAGQPGDYRQYSQYITSTIQARTSHLATSVMSAGDAATALLARTNPSRPEVSIGNFIHELKDLPGMLKDIGKLKLTKKPVFRNPRDIANWNLSIQMGWLPFFSDISKLLQFQALTDRRVIELQRLYSAGGLKRRLNLGADIKDDSAVLTIESALGVLIQSRAKRTTTVTQWGTVRWVPTTLPPFDPSSEKFRKWTRNVVLGTDFLKTPSVAYNAIPWTWLIDWFSNLGDYVEAHNNAIPCVHSTPCIMRRSVTQVIWERTDAQSWVSGGQGTSQLESKTRTITGGTVSAKLPFLDGRKLSILGSLALQRLR